MEGYCVGGRAGSTELMVRNDEFCEFWSDELGDGDVGEVRRGEAGAGEAGGGEKS